MSASDTSRSLSSSITPSRNFFTITPHDTNALAVLPKALYIATDGVLSVDMGTGTTAVTFNVVAGQIIPIRPQRVLTATTATVIALA